MQPHSMCMLALVHYVWNDPYHDVIGPQHVPAPDKADMRVEYRNRFGEYVSKYYTLSNITESTDKMTMSAFMMRSNGGIACKITARRNTTADRSTVRFVEHSQIHVSGLMEEFTLGEHTVTDGRHYNSAIYREFKGEQPVKSDRKKYKLSTEVKQAKTGSYQWTDYTLEITSLSPGK